MRSRTGALYRGRELWVVPARGRIGIDPGPVRRALSTAFPRPASVFSVRARKLSRALSTGTGEGNPLRGSPPANHDSVASHRRSPVVSTVGRALFAGKTALAGGAAEPEHDHKEMAVE